MRILTIVLLGLALVLATGSPSLAFGHHRNPAKGAMKDVKRARKAAAKQDRPKLLHHHKK